MTDATAALPVVSKNQRAERGRTFLLEVLPFVVFLALILAKASYFNYQPKTYFDNDWYPWWREEAIHAEYGSVAALLILLSPLLLLRPTKRFLAMCVVNFVLSVIVLGDVLSFRFYGDIMAVAAAKGAWQLILVWRSVVALLKPSDILFFADVVVALVLYPWYRRQVAATPAAGPRARRIAAATAFVTGCLLALLPLSIVSADTDGVFRYKYFRFFGARKIGLINYHIYDIEQRVEHSLFASNGIPPRVRHEALSVVSSWRPTATARSPLFGVARGKNLIMIMVESLQTFPLGLKIDGQEVMPNMDAFARRSLYFDRFFSQSADGTTSDGEFTSLQSLYPLQAGSVQTTYPMNNYHGIPSVLDARGYATMSAHAYYGELFNMRLVHPRLGFQKSFFREDYIQRDTLGLGLSDAEFFRQTLPRLQREPRPFMAFLITLSTHHDWKLPKEFRTLKVGELEESLVGRYLQAMHHFDEGFGQLVDSLSKNGLLDQSVIVIYGDHKAKYGKGEAEGRVDLARLLTRNAGWSPPDSGYDYRYWAVQNQVPLIIHLPHDQAAGKRSVTGGHLDIAPTVLNLLGVENAPMMMLGRDLTRGEDEFVVFRNGSFVYADTLCATPNASAQTAKCRDTRTGALLESLRFERRFEEARRRLEASDVIISGNLIADR